MSHYAPLATRHTPQCGGIILKLIVLVACLVFALAIYLLHAPILRFAAHAWIVDEPPQPSDAIILLSPDNVRSERAARAAELYRGRWAPRIITSGSYVRPYANIADLMRRDLTERGVPAEAIAPVLESGSNTREEAYIIRKLLSEKKWTRVIVVTSNYHTRRARYIWRRVGEPDVEVMVVSAKDSDFDPDKWWRSRKGLKLAFNEFIGSLVAFVEMQRGQ